MTFSDAAIANCINHLGYPLNSLTKNMVTQKLDLISNLGSSYQQEIEKILTDLDNIESEIDTFVTDSQVGITVNTTGIVYNGGTISGLNNLLMGYKRKLSVAVDLPLGNTSGTGCSRLLK